MGKFIDRTGMVYGQLTVLFLVSKADKATKKKPRWMCKCACGDTREYAISNLVSGNTTKCILCRVEKQVIHGHARRSQKSPASYNSWVHMKSRCINTEDDNYPSYGGRGISVDKNWLVYKNFLSDMGDCPEGLTLERLDVDGDYTKSNCIWASRSVQSYNRREDKRNTSGFEGVGQRRDTGKFTSYLDKEGIRYRGGCFDTLEAAKESRVLLEIEHYGSSKR